jgi:transposase-like protein
MKTSIQSPECKFDMNLVKLVEHFNSEDKCRDYLAELRWPKGVECPRCKSKSISKLKEQPKYDCNACRYQFTVTAGSIFHDTHLPLWKWFLAVYLVCESKKGMSANQLKRTLAVSYKTAWYLCHRIRAAMNEAQPKLLNGTVEVDETYVGGKRRHVGRGFKKNKTIIAGAKQRGGDARLEIIRGIDRKTLHKFIHKHTAPETEAIYTDELPSYNGIADADTRHESVNHSAEEWVRGDVHTNGVESVWSLLKRSIVGSYHKVSVKHLDAYLDELEHRFNNRNNEFLFRDTLLKLVNAETLTFHDLITA